MPRNPFRRRKSLRERIAERLHETTEQVSEKVEDAGETIGEKASQAREEIVSRASDVNARATERAQALAAKSPELDRDKLMQEARDVANNAASAALDLWERTRHRTEAVAHAAPTREQITGEIEAAAHALEKKARDAQAAAQKSAAEAKERVRRIEPVVEEKLEVARDRTGELAEGSAKAGKNLFALLFWLAAAAAVVYYLVFDRDRREKINDLAKAVANEVREVAGDIRGHDGTF